MLKETIERIDIDPFVRSVMLHMPDNIEKKTAISIRSHTQTGESSIVKSIFSISEIMKKSVGSPILNLQRDFERRILHIRKQKLEKTVKRNGFVNDTISETM